MEQKLIQTLQRNRNEYVMHGLQPISPGMDVSYEAGRRIGVSQGMDLMIQHVIAFFTDEASKENTL